MNTLEQEFTELVETHKKTIYTVCYFYSKSEEEVNDYFQETLINLWKGFEHFRGDCSPKTWVYRVSLNTCNDQLRRKRRRVDTIPLEVNIHSVGDDSSENPHIRRLHERINRLNPFDRAIILLWLEDMSYGDIADIVGITPANVTTRLHRIREQLKAMSNQ